MDTPNNIVINSSPLVSVITPCYNDGPYILDCVDSVQKSTYTNIEHIIVDDGSNQTTKDVLATIHFPNIRIITKENEGVCIARNLAIKVAKGKYILPLDGDDIITKNYISDAVTLMEKDNSLRVVTSEITQTFGITKVSKVVEKPFDMGKLLSRNLFTITTLIRREDALKVGCFDIDFNSGLEDWNFWISLMSLGGEIDVVPGVNFYYRLKSKHRNEFSSKELDRLKRMIWSKHRQLYSEFYADPMESDTCFSLRAAVERPLYKIALSRIKRQILKIIR